MKRKVTAPIILVGTGRSGSTAIHRLLSKHQNLAWLSDFSNRFPDKPQINRALMHIIDFPMIGSVLQRRMRAGEGYPFWEQYARGFGRPFRDLLSTDITSREKELVRQAMAENLTDNRSRLLLKVTGWPRIGFLIECFPDAKFVHLVRDGRAVANSMLAVPFWDGWRGPDRWRWDSLSPEHRAIWEESGRSFVALAGLEWVIMQSAMERASKDLTGSQFLQITYEDFCANKPETMKRVVDFSDIPWTRDFEQHVQQYPARNTNFKWTKELTHPQQQILTEILGPYLEKYGYE